LTYEEFNDFLSYIHKMTGEDLPPLSIIRDLFDFIDVKKDGIIDLNEWIETFNHVTVKIFYEVYFLGYRG
jgi:Ca2+-binding EF-hand superfamily protein